MSADRRAKRFKVGIVCEGQRGCAEEQVFPHLIKLICPEATFDIVPSGNRPTVLESAPSAAKNLFATGCGAVFVIWDVFPGWRETGGGTDCKEHVKTLKDNLKAADMDKKVIVAVAIREELEAWLLCDADALMAVIAPLIKKKPIKHENAPDSVPNPKKRLERLFRLGRGQTLQPLVQRRPNCQ